MLNLIRRVIHCFTFLHVFRVPVTILALLAGLPYIAGTAARALLENTVQALTAGEVFFVGVFAALTAFSAITAATLIVEFGDERLRNDPPWFVKFRSFPVSWIGFAAMLPLLWQVSAGCTGGFAAGAGMAALGVFVAFLIATAARTLQLLVADPMSPKPAVGLLPDLFLLTPLFDWVYRRQLRLLETGLAKSIQDWFARVTADIPEWLGRGYFRYENGKAVSWHSGHAFAATMCTITFALYLVGGALLRTHMAPTLAYILVLLLLASWSFSALAFFGDRHRIPVLTLFVLYCAASAALFETDHYFPAARRSYESPSPARMLADNPEAIVVVAAEGGGIQAAGWSARVLTGLAKEVEGFGGRVRMVSGVSGGSVGAYYFANSYAGANKPDAATLDAAVEGAMGSSLDEVAWGLTNPDLQRAIVPVLWWARDRFEDRGQALERTFDERSGQGPRRVWLSEWARETAAGKVPPVIFNATIVERGSPLVFSTTRFPAAPGSIANLDQLLDGPHDVPVTTAVRLSATFPIVSPAARPYVDGNEKRKLHVVDGGYYDNLGVSSLVAWLREAIPSPESAPVKRILVLTLHAFQEPGENNGSARSWSYQLAAPVDAILQVRTAAQIHRGAQELALLRDAWKGKVDVQPVSVRFPGCEQTTPPLSWQLREDQKDCIRHGWEREKGPLVDRVRDFLKPAAK